MSSAKPANTRTYTEDEIKRAQKVWMRIIIPCAIVSTAGLIYFCFNPHSLWGDISETIFACLEVDIFLSLFDPRFKDKKYREKLVSILIAMALVAVVLIIVFVDWGA